MDVRFEPKGVRTTISFLPEESDELSVLMQLVIESEKSRGKRVPNFNADFFRTFATADKKFIIEFPFEHLDFVIVYLDEVIDEMVGNGSDPTLLGEVVNKIESYCFRGEYLQ